MKVQTLSLVAGTEACDAKGCPWCVARMTGKGGCAPKLNIHRLEKAIQIAERMDVLTAMITGKGEPMLYPQHIITFLEHLEGRIPIIELQTNGIKIAEMIDDDIDALITWAKYLDLIAISTTGNPELNRLAYCDPYLDLKQVTRGLKSFGFSTRLCVILMKGLDTARKVGNYLEYVHGWGSVDQVTLTYANYPKHSVSDPEYRWLVERKLSTSPREEIQYFLEKTGTHLLDLSHGARVYDVNGMSVCLNDCLGAVENSGVMRNLIYYPDGRISYSWEYEGARIL